jgi:hypothetical protein
MIGNAQIAATTSDMWFTRFDASVGALSLITPGRALLQKRRWRAKG